MPRKTDTVLDIATQLRVARALLFAIDTPRPAAAAAAVPPGYVLVRADDLRALRAVLREAVMSVRLATLLAHEHERQLADGLTPTLRYAVGELVRTLAH